MRFWTKTYFCVLILFLVVFNSSIFGVMFTTYQSMLFSEKEKALGENSFIKQSLENDIEILNSNKEISDLTIKNLMEYYSNYYNDKNKSFLLLKDSSVLFSNLQFNMAKLDNGIINNKNGKLIEQNENKYVVVSSIIDSPTIKYNLVYCYKLEKVMNEWNRLKVTFIFFSLAVSFILAILLAMLLNRRSKPLNQLISYVNQIKNGDYSNKIKIRGNDEFSILGENFNEMSENIQATLKQLNSDMQMKQKFIDNLSHELRTPLTSISGYAEYIQKAAISEEERYEATQFIIEESGRLLYMSNRLLDMTIRRQADIVKTEINIDNLFQKVVKTISPIANKKSIHIDVSNKLSHIIGEQQLLESLLINILDNAIKASGSNQIVEIRGLSLEGEKIIQIIDKGKGISKEHISHITEPFYRADKARDKSEGGTGLGLALCAQIMDIHNGKFEINSELDKGTTVTLRFTS